MGKQKRQEGGTPEYFHIRNVLSVLYNGMTSVRNIKSHLLEWELYSSHQIIHSAPVSILILCPSPSLIIWNYLLLWNFPIEWTYFFSLSRIPCILHEKGDQFCILLRDPYNRRTWNTSIIGANQFRASVCCTFMWNLCLLSLVKMFLSLFNFRFFVAPSFSS